MALSVARSGLSSGVAALGLLVALSAGSRAQAPLPLAALPLHVDAPAANPATPMKVALGRLLFWDPILSDAQDVACATCHHPDHGYSDGRDLPISTGGRGLGAARTFHGGPSQVVRRNAPSILNIGFSGISTESQYDPTIAPMFWDMRVLGLEAQALDPITTLEEMRGGGIGPEQAVAAAVARVAQVRQYRDEFRQVFGGRLPVTALTWHAPSPHSRDHWSRPIRHSIGTCAVTTAP